MRTNPTLKKYLDEAGELPPDALLGCVVMFTINDTPIKRADIVQWFDDLSLNPAHVPPELRAVDAYKKATTSAEGFEYQLDDGNTATILCRDVASNKDFIVRHLVREIRDSQRRRLAFEMVVEATFYRPTVSGGVTQPGTERFRLTVDGSVIRDENERLQIEALTDRVETAYDLFANHLDGQKLRSIVRSYLLYLNAIELRAGVYFVHVNRTDELMRLRQLVDKFGNGCRMYLIPLVDLENEREMVVEAFQREAQESLNAIVVEIATLRSTRKTVTPEAYAKIKARYDAVVNQANEYLRTLGITQDATAAAAELALDSLADLQISVLSSGGQP